MTDSYVTGKVREALALSHGSRGHAQRLLLKWVQSDDRLLRGLAAPFLKAIVTSAVERATRPVVQPRPDSAAAASAGKTLAPEMLDRVLAQMGRRPAGSADAPPPRPSGTVRRLGADQAASMRVLAAVFQRKRERL